MKAAIEAGIIPGIKVDAGTTDLAAHPGEKITEGLDGLRERLTEYAQLGARFAKWRAVITIGDGIPSRGCIRANAHVLARYAALCQEAGLVPIVEPEVLMDGDHTLERCRVTTEEVLHAVFDELIELRVLLEGMLLKPNMVLPGLACPKQETVDEVADATVTTPVAHRSRRCARRGVLVRRPTRRTGVGAFERYERAVQIPAAVGLDIFLLTRDSTARARTLARRGGQCARRAKGSRIPGQTQPRRPPRRIHRRHGARCVTKPRAGHQSHQGALPRLDLSPGKTKLIPCGKSKHVAAWSGAGRRE